MILSSVSSRTLEDVTNNVKQISSSSSPQRTHLYKKKLAPLTNSNDLMNKKISLSFTYRTTILQYVDDVPSDRSEETSAGTSTGVQEAEEEEHEISDQQAAVTNAQNTTDIFLLFLLFLNTKKNNKRKQSVQFFCIYIFFYIIRKKTPNNQ